jgi:uncharacterized membrane protein YdjX (TVP38/TMEM64 family)
MVGVASTPLGRRCGNRTTRISSVFLLRDASVVPFAPLNCVLGAGRVRGRDFFIGSWLGLLPGTFMYVCLGSLVPRVSEILSGNFASTSGCGRGLYWFGFAAMLLIVARIARDVANRTVEKGT